MNSGLSSSSVVVVVVVTAEAKPLRLLFLVLSPLVDFDFDEDRFLLLCMRRAELLNGSAPVGRLRCGPPPILLLLVVVLMELDLVAIVLPPVLEGTKKASTARMAG